MGCFLVVCRDSQLEEFDVIYVVSHFDVEMWRLLRLIESPRGGTKDEKLLLARPKTSFEA